MWLYACACTRARVCVCVKVESAVFPHPFFNLEGGFRFSECTTVHFRRNAAGAICMWDRPTFITRFKTQQTKKPLSLVTPPTRHQRHRPLRESTVRSPGDEAKSKLKANKPKKGRGWETRGRRIAARNVQSPEFLISLSPMSIC